MTMWIRSLGDHDCVLPLPLSLLLSNDDNETMILTNLTMTIDGYEDDDC